MKAQDTKAAEIGFGVELETFIPQHSQVVVGGYHNGRAVVSGRTVTGETITAPTFNGQAWKSERDGSIRPDGDMLACEFVSPILKGEAGLVALRDFVAFIRAIGGEVNASCGCHVTIGVASVIGTSDRAAVVHFAKKLANLAFKHQWAIYAQTGTNRHVNNTYSHTLRSDTPANIRSMLAGNDAAVYACGRGCLNFQKLLGGSAPLVEFRAFAGTLNTHKLFHHVATCLALVRRASELSNPGGFRKTKKEAAKLTSAAAAVKYFWQFAGWTGNANRTVALGLFGLLHSEFRSYRKVALEMAGKFEEKFPGANL